MTQENIFLFVPNLIGYARVVLALLSFYLMPSSPWPAVFCYLLSALLDAFDGHAARSLDQATKFGAMMDMLTDRCATMCLLVNLALLYPAYAFLFQLSMSLDIASHWLHLHSSTVKGSGSHKTIDLSGNPILRLYYTSKVRTGPGRCSSHDSRLQSVSAGSGSVSASSVRDVRWERTLLLPALHPASHPEPGRLAPPPPRALRRRLPPEGGHQRPPPGHRLPEHGRPGRRRARQEALSGPTDSVPVLVRPDASASFMTKFHKITNIPAFRVA